MGRPLILIKLILVVGTLISCRSETSLILIPGVGISIDKDTTFINRTTFEELLLKLNLPDTFPILIRHWDGFDENGNDVYGDEYFKEIYKRNIVYEYVGTNKDSLSLNWIRVECDRQTNGTVGNSIEFQRLSDEVDILFPAHNRHDYVSDSRLSYNLYSRGISFLFDSVDGKRILTEISIHHALTENK